jgi:hypothetical protein
LQPVAISGNSRGRKNRRNKPEPLPWVAAGCLDLVARLSTADAIAGEGAERMTYLPSRVIDSLFRDRATDASPLLEGQLAAMLRIDPAEIVWVPKAGRVGSYRPVTALTPLTRVLLRALSTDLHDRVRPPDRSVAAFRDFQTAVLTVPQTTHVVVGDVASFTSSSTTRCLKSGSSRRRRVQTPRAPSGQFSPRSIGGRAKAHTARPSDVS